MTKNELKNIIKGLIIESINESTPKGFPQSIKKKVLKQYPGKAGKSKAYATMNKIAKNLNEEDEMEPFDPQASAEPDAGEVEGPEDVGPTGNELLLSQIDNIIQSLNDMKASLQGNVEGEEGEEEMGGEGEESEEEPPVQ